MACLRKSEKQFVANRRQVVSRNVSYYRIPDTIRYIVSYHCYDMQHYLTPNGGLASLH